MSSTARMMSQAGPRRIPPRAEKVVSETENLAPGELSERIQAAVVNALRGEWMAHRPADRSEHSWKDVQQFKLKLKLSDLDHIYRMLTLKAAMAKAAVLQELEAARGNERRLTTRRIAPYGRRRDDIAGGAR